MKYNRFCYITREILTPSDGIYKVRVTIRHTNGIWYRTNSFTREIKKGE